MNTGEIIYYGGSFNPPHIAHVLFAAALRSYFPDAEIWVAPTYSHAFHKSLMDYDLRLRMLHASFAPIQGVCISTIERDLHESTSYTIDVVREILRRHPGCAVRIAVGADIVPTLGMWRGYDELCKLASFLVFPREGCDNSVAINMPHLPEISSSEIRNAIELGDWDYVRKFVPARVFDILREM
ncbi:MAG: nicotinate-nicotinamide nucleotide adenylyltransferase [Proteobacteria bacterium]|nr:nicotinate-nicotinamide nucleotide adenylyltransferase [Pseudomonadota bacterium]